MRIQVSERVWLTGTGTEGALEENNLAVEFLLWICGAEIDGAG